MKKCLAPSQLTVNLLSCPCTVDKNALTFAFAMDDKGQNITLQAYRFVFAGSEQALAEGDYVLDTGFIADSESCGIVLPGLADALQADSFYACAVQTRNNKGEESEFSAPLCFLTAPEVFHAQAMWVGEEGAYPDFAFLRFPFTLKKAPAKAYIQVTATSPEPSRQYVYQTHCNGTFVNLGPTRMKKDPTGTKVYYDTAEVTHLLQAGENCLGATCYTLDDKRFACRLILVDEAGNITVMGDTLEGWQAMDGTAAFRPAGSIGTNYFHASCEHIDGNVFPSDFATAAFTGTGFVPACPRPDLNDRFALKPFPAPAVTRFDRPVVASQYLNEDGTWFLDLGKEIIGGVGLICDIDTQTDITLRFGEELDKDGRVMYKMRTTNVYEQNWTLKAGHNNLWNTDMKTYRYVEVVGLPEDFDVNAFRGLAYETTFDEKQSFFTSSDELLNAIYDLCKYTIKATNQHLFVDSQSRERCAYEGDVVINMLTAAGVQDVNALARFSIDYLITHRTWPAEYVLFCILMTKLDYLYTGDAALLQSRFDALQTKMYWDWLDENVGLLRSRSTAGNGTDAVLVDWPVSERDGYLYADSYFNTVLNSVHYHVLCDMAYLAEQLNSPLADDYKAKADSLKAAMIKHLYNPQTGAFYDGLNLEYQPMEHHSQHATAYALFAGVYDSEQMKNAMASFLRSQGSIRTSVYTAFFLFEGLYSAGAGDFANALMLCPDTDDTARTWAFMLDRLDATISAEAFHPADKGNMTFSHPWGSAPGSQIVRGLFGIRPLTPGFADFSLDLQPAPLRYASLQVPTVKGAIVASFNTTQADCDLAVTVTVPANTTAHVSLPAGENRGVFANGEPVNAGLQNGRLHFALGSGDYSLEVR